MILRARTFSRPVLSLPIPASLACLLVLFLVSACGSHESASSQSGSISFAVQKPTAQAYRGLAQAAMFDCAQHDIESVEARVEDVQGNIVATGGPWACDTGEAILTDVPAGENYTVIVSLRNSSGVVMFEGIVSGITVLAGVTTDAGSINLGYANRPPILSVPTAVRHVTTNGTLAFGVSATDPDGDNLTFDIGDLPYDVASSQYWTGVDFAPDPLNPDADIFTWDLSLLDIGAGEYTVLIRVTDDGTPRMTATKWVTIQVYDTDTGELDGYYPPILNRISLPSAISVNVPVQFTVTATNRNSEGDITYSAQEIPDKSSGLSEYFDGNTHQFQWTPEAQGNYWVRFVAAFSVGAYSLTDYEDVLFTVGDVDRPPRLDPLGDKKFEYNELHQFVVTADDPEFDPITYAAYYVPAAAAPQPVSAIGAAFDPETQVFSWQPDEGDIGHTYTIRFRAQDGSGAYDVQDVDISVVNE
ncbi:MAG: hypothetical protein ABFD81_00620 [Syntrophaceae bacterium]